MADEVSGLEGVVAAETVLSHVDGEHGRLIIRGFPLEVLAPQGFEHAIALLWDGFVPAADIAERLGAARKQAFDELGRWLLAARGRPLQEGMRLALFGVAIGVMSGSTSFTHQR